MMGLAVVFSYIVLQMLCKLMYTSAYDAMIDYEMPWLVAKYCAYVFG